MKQDRLKTAQIEALVLAILACGARQAAANPQGVTVRSGAATVSTIGSQMVIKASSGAVLNWSSFSIATGETTTFVQPSSTSWVLNRVTGSDPSQIYGHLNANGYVFLQNQNGIYFGKDSVISTAGFVATTSAVTEPSGGVGGFWQFSGPPPTASIVNYGQITAASGGSIFLIAEKIENHGTLSAPDGSLGLYAGKEVMVCDSPDGRGLSAKVTLPEGSVSNTGKLIADAGTIALNAQIVNQDGFIQADSIKNRNGEIELVASEALALGPDSVLSAKGGADGASAGGKISIKAETFTDDPASKIDVTGGAQGGNGGSVSLCADNMSSVNSAIDGTALTGWTGGSLTLDPKDIVIGTTGSSPITTTTGDDGSKTGSTSAGATDPSSTTPDAFNYNVNSSFKGFSKIDLQAKQTITIAKNTLWDLGLSTGVSSPGCLLSLEAGTILFQDGAKVIGSDGWSISLSAGLGTSAPAGASAQLKKEWGGIYLNGGYTSSGSALLKGNSGFIKTTDGNLTLSADTEVIGGNKLGYGSICTTGGGSINIAAKTGNVDAGNNGNSFTSSTDKSSMVAANADQPGQVDQLGGIATASGGDVTINAGGAINCSGATIGCYGKGDLTLKAAQINEATGLKGGLVVFNGQGLIDCGTTGAAGTLANPLTLGLVKGGWTVIGKDVFVNEIYNPNGSYNDQKNPVTQLEYTYDYADNASVTLKGYNSVHLLGTTPTRAITPNGPIYAPILNIEAGDGGIELANAVILFPSSKGGLSIKTTGSFYGTTGKDDQLIMSDSGSLYYSDILKQSSHTTTPLAWANGKAVTVDVGGDINNLLLTVPKKAEINVGGDTLNFFFTAQNLLPTDTTIFNVKGNIGYCQHWYAVTPNVNVDLSIFDATATSDPALNLRSLLTYYPEYGILTFTGKMTAEQRDYLLNPKVKKLKADGTPVLDGSGNPVYVPAPFISASLVNQLYAASQSESDLSVLSYGINIGGPGALVMKATSMDLGVTTGIKSKWDALNPNMINEYGSSATPGASITVALTGDLVMRSSRIASYSGGGVSVAAGGAMDIGTQIDYTKSGDPTGIWTADGGDVTVVAKGDVDVNGSRVASFDGGDVWVESQTGAVNAGTGGNSAFNIQCPIAYNPKDGTKTFRGADDYFFGSGIVATTRSQSKRTVGNITILADKDVICSAGGVLQLPVNRYNFSKQWVKILSSTGNIIANDSGIVGINPDVNAPKGTVTGLIVAQRDLTIHAEGNVNVTALSGGSANVSSSSGDIKGSIVAVGNVTVGAESITATVFSTGGETSSTGDTSGGKVGGAFAGVAAPTTVKNATDTADTATQEQAPGLDSDENEQKKKGAKAPLLAKSTGRVTVVLPKQ